MKNIAIRITLVLAIVIVLIVAPLACFLYREEDNRSKYFAIEEDNGKTSISLFAMDTYMTITAYDTNAKDSLEEVALAIQGLDKMLSTGNSESEVYKLNHSNGGQLNEVTGLLLDKSIEIYTMTKGSFDITVYPVMKLWGFTDGNYVVPDEASINAIIENVSSSKLEVDKKEMKVYLPEGIEIDFGGIAKGYTGDVIKNILKSKGIKEAVINLGGNVCVLGDKNGNGYRIGIQNPDASKDYLGVIEAKDISVVTSGGYERYFESAGQRYHHIIDPKTGKPAESGLLSVTVICQDGTLADGLSTALFVMGKEETITFWKENSSMFDCILLTTDGELYVTENIADVFATDMKTNVIYK